MSNRLITHSVKFSTELQEQLAFEEGIRLHAYLDTAGLRTIGVGHNMIANPKWEDSGIPIADTITETEMVKLLEADLLRTERELIRAWPSYLQVRPGARRDAVLQMAFQLGVTGLMQFVKMKQLLEHGYYEDASIAAMNSKWAKQVPARSARVAEQIRTGNYYVIPKTIDWAD